MSKRKRLILMPHPDGGWQLKWEKGSRALRRFDKKEEALGMGRQIAKANPPSQLQIRGQDGKIQDEHTYGGDPERYPD